MNCYDKIIKFHKENDIQYERYSLLSLAFLFLLLDKNYYNNLSKLISLDALTESWYITVSHS